MLGCSKRRASGFSGYAFIANQDSRSVAAVDLTAFAMIRQIPLEAGPTAVIAHPKQPLVYVLTPEIGVVYEISAPRLSVTRKSRLGAPAISMRMAPDGSALWALCREPRSLVRLSLDQMQPTARIRLPAIPDDFDVWDGRLAAVSFPHDRSIGLADLGSLGVERISTRAEPHLVRFRSDGKQILLGNRGTRTVTILDVQTRRSVVHFPVPLEPANFCFKADGGQLFVTGPGMDAVVVIFPYSTEVSETVLAGRAPDAMAALSSPEHEYLFVANPESANVTVLDIDSRRVVAVVTAGEEPRHIAFTPDNQYALVLNRKSGDIAVIRIASLSGRRTRAAPLFTMIPVGSRPVSAAMVESRLPLPDGY
jgi:YVTN family beta-propeller protein